LQELFDVFCNTSVISNIQDGVHFIQ